MGQQKRVEGVGQVMFGWWCWGCAVVRVRRNKRTGGRGSIVGCGREREGEEDGGGGYMGGRGPSGADGGGR